MPIVRCYVDENLRRFLAEKAADRGISIERACEAAIENAALSAGYRAMTLVERLERSAELARRPRPGSPGYLELAAELFRRAGVD